MVWITVVLFWALVAAVAVAAAAALFPGTKCVDGARQRLRERFARGEISAAEYREGVRTLHAEGKDSPGWTAAGVVVLLAVLAVGLVLGMGGWGMHGWRGMPGMPMMPHMGRWTPTPTSAPRVLPGARVVAVELVDFAFRPGAIRVRAGETVNLRLRNVGRVPHDLYVPGLGFRAALNPGQEVVAGLAADRPGTYEFYCTLPGHREAGMSGTLVVSP